MGSGLVVVTDSEFRAAVQTAQTKGVQPAAYTTAAMQMYLLYGLILSVLFGYGGNDEVAEDGVRFFGGTLLFVKELLPVGFAGRVSEFGLCLLNCACEIGREVTLVSCDLLRVFVQGVVRDYFLPQTVAEIGFACAVSATFEVVNRVFE